jgi:phenylacetate-coenzyme A ligase PaaK-like adenylate-forming protein
MGIKVFLGKIWASLSVRNMQKWMLNAPAKQEEIFQQLLQKGKHTVFGKDHHFDKINNYEDFKKLVPIHDYEDLRPYIDQILEGQEDVLWPQKPLYFAKTSGTTSGVKYIPITKDSMPHHLNGARLALLSYVNETGKADFLNGKLIFLQGSPKMDTKKGIKIGRLSGIVANHVPSYLQTNRLPSYETNCIEDWEQKLDAIIDETLGEDMRLISGIPPWCQMYFDKLLEKTGKKYIKDIFPNFKLFVYGGVNYEPYRAKIKESLGFEIDSIETYPASEGFIAFQNKQQDPSLLLLVNADIFFEFIPADQFYNENPTRLKLDQVELNQNYALILSTMSGLWAYSIGDTVKFVSKNPYKILVTGRIKHYISAFGEHVIGEEVEGALAAVAKKEKIEITEFTVAPQVNPAKGDLPYHQWMIEFVNEPKDLNSFALALDEALQQKNIYYKDLIAGKILKPLVISSLKKDSFINYMRKEGKLGGQNKVPRLANDRILADNLEAYIK